MLSLKNNAYLKKIHALSLLWTSEGQSVQTRVTVCHIKIPCSLGPVGMPALPCPCPPPAPTTSQQGPCMGMLGCLWFFLLSTLCLPQCLCTVCSCSWEDHPPPCPFQLLSCPQMYLLPPTCPSQLLTQPVTVRFLYPPVSLWLPPHWNEVPRDKDKAWTGHHHCLPGSTLWASH